METIYQILISSLPGFIGVVIGALVTLYATMKQTRVANKFIILSDLKAQVKNDIHQFHSILNDYYNLISQFSLAIVEENKSLILGETYTKIIVLHNEMTNLNNNLNGNYELMILKYKEKNIQSLGFSEILLSFKNHLDYQSKNEHPILAECIKKYASNNKLTPEEKVKNSRNLLSIYDSKKDVSKKYTTLMGYSGVHVIEFLNKKIARLI